MCFKIFLLAMIFTIKGNSRQTRRQTLLSKNNLPWKCPRHKINIFTPAPGAVVSSTHVPFGLKQFKYKLRAAHQTRNLESTTNHALIQRHGSQRHDFNYNVVVMLI